MANNLVLKYYECKPKILDVGRMFAIMGNQPIIDNIYLYFPIKYENT